VAEMARAAVVGLATAPASLSIVEDAHARVKETANARLISVIGSCVLSAVRHFKSAI
jgi:hypothetical protein